jgi:hypothetical protein
MDQRLLEAKFRGFYAKEFREQNKDHFTTKSPYAITTEQPTSRLVDNPITKGSWSCSGPQVSVERGFFGGIKDVSVEGGGRGGNIDTTVQFDEIFLCPVTHREFLTKDLDDYFEELRKEQDCYAWQKTRKKINGAHIDSNTLNVINGKGDILFTRIELASM